MAPPAWIHCSLCYRLMMSREHPFYHLSCRHIICRPCMAKTNRGTVCPVCKRTLKRFVELNNQIERKDKMWYDPSASKIYELACQTLMFQQKHREHLIGRILQARTNLPRLNGMVSQLSEHVVERQRQYEKLRSFRRRLQENLRQSKPPLPASGATQSSWCEGTPASSLRPSGQFRVPMRRMSTDCAMGSQQNETVTSSNESFGTQQSWAGRFSNRRLSVDSGIGTVTPSSVYNSGGSSKHVRFSKCVSTFLRPSPNSSFRN